MNPLVKKLALQAGHPGFPRGEIELQKFAELIICECAELTLQHKNDDYYTGWLDYRDEIKQHFGLKP